VWALDRKTQPRSPRRYIVFSKNPKFEDRTLKDGEKVGYIRMDRLTDGRTGLMNSTEHIFRNVLLKKSLETHKLQIIFRFSVKCFHFR
jgi:hypothetical protein